MTESMAEDEVVIPRWQPDNELSGCSICGNTFTFLNRRHHCRRCGRLVCGPCSPHRITIPRQYIVHSAEEDQDSTTRSRSNTASTDPLENPALGGGETVRVCNPCVPDPNYGLPPQHGQQVSSPPSTSRSRAQTYASENPTSGIGFLRAAAQVVGADLTPTTSQSAPHNASSLSSYVGSPSRQVEGRRAAYRPRLHTARYQALNIAPRRPQAPVQGLRTHSDNDTANLLRTRYRSLSYTPEHLTQLPRAQAQAQATTDEEPPPQSREALGEENECPVCGTRLHPFGTTGTSEEREQHVEFCISSHLAGPSRGESAAQAATVVSESTTEGDGVQTTTPESAPRRASSLLGASTARQRMLVYSATEKDCFDEDGEAQECIICLEEFEEGVQMGRLECLCKFHRACIRGWWEQRGKGTCPTHQLHD